MSTDKLEYDLLQKRLAQKEEKVRKAKHIKLSNLVRTLSYFPAQDTCCPTKPLCPAQDTLSY